MKTIKIFGGIAIAAFATLAGAAGFEGAYGGVSAGGAVSRTKTDQSLFKPNIGNQGISHLNTINGFASLRPTVGETDFTGGGQIGYNWRSGGTVFGVELDANNVGLRESATASTTFAVFNGTRTLTSTDSVDSTYMLTLRPRIGFMVSDKSMVYLTAGLALSDLRFTNRSTATSTAFGGTVATYNSSASKRNGTVIGAGYERAISQKMSWRVEYQHLQFGRAASTGAADTFAGTSLEGSSLNTGYKTKVDILRVGVNWKF